MLDVPTGARALAYGFFVSGGGKMWVNGQRIEEVGLDVPTTDMLKKQPPLPMGTRQLNLKHLPSSNSSARVRRRKNFATNYAAPACAAFLVVQDPAQKRIRQD